jgi:hypothetical protein
MRFVFLCLLAFAISLKSNAQRNEIIVKAGYGPFAMKDMKKLQNSFMKEAFIPYKTTVSFPSFFTFELQYIIDVNDDVAFGCQLGYKSTGGRMHYGDYSGESYVNQELGAFSVGFNTSEYIKKEEKYAIPIFVNVDAVFTGLRIESGLRLGVRQETKQQNFSSIGISFEPGVGYRRYFSRFVLGFDIGYELNLNDKLYLSDDNQAYLIDENNEPLKAQWSGFRMKLGTGIRF